MSRPTAKLRRDGLFGQREETYASTDREIGWMDDGDCRHHDPELWFPIGVVPDSTVQICLACPVLARCQEYAWLNGIIDGVWGGLQATGRAAWFRWDVLPADWPESVVHDLRYRRILAKLREE